MLEGVLVRDTGMAMHLIPLRLMSHIGTLTTLHLFQLYVRIRLLVSFTDFATRCSAQRN